MIRAAVPHCLKHVARCTLAFILRAFTQIHLVSHTTRRVRHRSFLGDVNCELLLWITVVYQRVRYTGIRALL